MDKIDMMSNKSDSLIPTQMQDRRSERTQQALIDALITLLAIKHYDAISIKEIVKQANVGRSTFYAHYQTKDDLLKSGFGRMLDAFLEHIIISNEDQSLQLNTTSLFRHAQGHYELYRMLMWGSGFDLLIRDGHAALSARLQARLTQLMPEKWEPPIPLSALSYSMAGSLLVLLKWWLDNKMPCSPEQMDEIVQQLVMPGIRATLGMTIEK